MERVIDFCEDVERLGDLPEQLDLQILVFIAKVGGGTRPIGLIRSILRLWCRSRRPLVRTWDADHYRHYCMGRRGTTADKTAWLQCFHDEHADAVKKVSASCVLDIRKCILRSHWKITVSPRLLSSMHGLTQNISEYLRLS